MSETEEIPEEKRKKVEEELKIRKLIGNFFEPNAIERMDNIQLSNPEVFNQILQLVFQNAQAGRLNKKISDEELKNLAGRILSQKRETKIKINRK